MADSGFSRNEKVQKLPARVISSELSAHQMQPSGLTPHWRSRSALQLACGPIVSCTHAVDEFPRGPQGTTASTTPPFVSRRAATQEPTIRNSGRLGPRAGIPKRLRPNCHCMSPRSRGVGTLRVGRPADYLPSGTVGQWPPATRQW